MAPVTTTWSQAPRGGSREILVRGWELDIMRSRQELGACLYMCVGKLTRCCSPWVAHRQWRSSPKRSVVSLASQAQFLSLKSPTRSKSLLVCLASRMALSNSTNNCSWSAVLYVGGIILPTVRVDSPAVMFPQRLSAWVISISSGITM